jgi:four helix bundle protein
MPPITKFEDLNIWKLSRELNIDMFRLLSKKDDRTYGFLINHLFKTSGSIMDNIAEGYERGGNKEFINFLSYSKGSAVELRSQLYRAFDLEILNQPDFDKLQKQTIQISKELSLFMNYLKKSDFKRSKFHEPPSS